MEHDGLLFSVDSPIHSWVLDLSASIDMTRNCDSFDNYISSNYGNFFTGKWKKYLEIVAMGDVRLKMSNKSA